MIFYPSTIFRYLQCPRKYWYHINYYPSVSPPFPPYMEYGKDIHELLERYYKEYSLRVNRGEAVLPEELMNTIIRRTGFIVDGRTKGILANWLKFENNRLQWSEKTSPILVEEEVVKQPFGGVIDLMVWRGNDKVVIDWKTGSYQGYLSYEYNIQGSIYLYITGAKEVIFFFLDSGVTEEVTDVDKEIFEIVKKIQEDKTYPLVIDEKCEDCEYQFICKLHRQGLTWKDFLLLEAVR